MGEVLGEHPWGKCGAQVLEAYTHLMVSLCGPFSSRYPD